MTTFQISNPAFKNLNWTIHRITGTEAMSNLFQFAITVSTDSDELEHAVQVAAMQLGTARTIESTTLQQQAFFTIADPDSSNGHNPTDRFGAIVGVAVLGMVPVSANHPVASTAVRFDVAPTAWITQHRRRSRVFQSKYMHEIVSTVLSEMKIRHQWTLNNTYPKLPYSVQYDESDWEYVTRLLAEEGVFFYFQHGEFSGGDAANLKEHPSAWDKVKKYGAAASKLAGVLAPKLTSDTTPGNTGGAIATALGIAGAAGDLLAGSEPLDDFDPAPIVPGSGAAGPQGPGDVMVMGDTPMNGYAATLRTGSPAMMGNPVSITLSLVGDDGLVGDSNELRVYVPRSTIRPTQAHLRDYWFMKPLLDVSVLSSGASSAAVGEASTLEVYAHHGEYDRPQIEPPLTNRANVVKEQYRADSAVFFGEGAQSELGPGVRFKFDSVVRTTVADDVYVIVKIRHDWTAAMVDKAADDLLAVVTALEQTPGLFPGPVAIGPGGGTLSGGSASAVYTSRFEAVQKDVPFRPPRPRREPRTAIELATVVGLVNEDIHTDPFGRVRIQFHWDREGKWLPSSSCWVRVAQTWAGAGFGTMFIPRVGMEVVVAFVGGDPDRPVVVGTLYNGIHPTPEPLPDRATRTVIRTQISPGGGDGNEIGFEDDKENARLYFRAQKDYELKISDNSTTSVKNAENKTVGGDQQIGVGGDRILGVGGSRGTLVSNNDSLQVGGDRSSRVSQNDSAFVDGDSLSSVSGVAVTSVDRDGLHVVGGDHTLRVNGNAVTHVGGGKSRETETHAITFVEGSWLVGSTGNISITADAGRHNDDTASLTLQCADSLITMKKGEITIEADVINVVGRKKLQLQGEKSAILLDEKGLQGEGKEIKLSTTDPNKKGSLVILGDTLEIHHWNCTKLKGADIHLVTPGDGGGGATSDEQKPDDPFNMVLCLSDEGMGDGTATGLPAGSKWRVIAADNQEYERQGTLEAGGILKVFLPQTIDIIDVFVWPDASVKSAYPEDQGPLYWKVHLVKDIPTLSDASKKVSAAKLRLRNLGYLPLADMEKAEMDDTTASAVRRFQRDQVQKDHQLGGKPRIKVNEADDDSGPTDDDQKVFPLDDDTIKTLGTVYDEKPSK